MSRDLIQFIFLVGRGGGGVSASVYIGCIWGKKDSDLHNSVKNYLGESVLKSEPFPLGGH